jgi:hypothetical protein
MAAEATTAEVMTAEVTTAEVTTAEVTTAEVTTAEVTTAEVTTAEDLAMSVRNAIAATGRIGDCGSFWCSRSGVHPRQS